MIPNRRHFLRAGSLTTLAGIAVAYRPAVGYADDITPAANTTLGDLITYSYGSPSFKQTLKEQFPQLVGDPHFAALAPLSAIYTLSGSSVILAMAVNWSFSTASGGYTHPMELENPASSVGNYPGQRGLIGNGTYLLVTPFFSWNPRQVPAVPIDWSSVTANTGSRRFVSSEALLSQKVQPTVMGVVLADGTLLGPKPGHLAKRVKRVQAGARDASLSIWKMLESKATDEQITQRLSKYINEPSTGAPATEKRIYEAAWRNQALFLYQLQINQPSAFKKTVKSVARQKKLNISVVKD